MVEIKDLLTSEDEQVFFDLNNTTIYIGSQNLGDGHIYVTNKNVHWISINNTTKYTFNFYSIGLNAVFSKNDDFPASVYCQIDQVIEPEGGNGVKSSESNKGEEEEEEEEENDDDDYTEVRFIPSDDSKIHPIYDALCQGALLNPDPEDEDDDEGDFYYGEDNNDQELAFDPNDLDRFQDAEEEDNN